MSSGQPKWPVSSAAKQDLMLAILALISAKTDNLDVELDTLAKSATQDLMKTATDNIKTQVDNLDVLLSDSVFRDFHAQYNGNDASKTINLATYYAPKNIRGQDLEVHNLGTASITIAVDGEPIKTVKKLDHWSLPPKTEWYIVAITNPSTVNFEITIVGDEI